MDAELLKLVLSDESFKAVGLMILFSLKGEVKQLKVSVQSLTERLGSVEEKQTARFERLEDRVERIELTKPKEG
jgi:hypothetical protein